ncbi:MAG TPA: serine/threonine-protein kinase [Caulifigura sp.]|nr:serine/threonine-protein kinase [Caulifigura sp.]
MANGMAIHPAGTAGLDWSPPVLNVLPTDRFLPISMTACAIPSPVTLNQQAALDPTLAYEPAPRAEPALTGDFQQLGDEFQRMLQRDEVSWEQSYDLVERIGAGGQGVVFLADRAGAFDVKFRLALKFFRPDGYSSIKAYRDEMARLARVAMELASVQQDHLLDIFNVIELRGIHVQAMEWVDGFDLRYLLTPRTLDEAREGMDPQRWQYMNDVIVTKTSSQLRLKPGVATAILRECLTGIAAMHRAKLVHGDLKPANIMVKRTGNCKIIDFGSAALEQEPTTRPLWTPRYAGVEVLEGAPHTAASDLASLGYVFYELLSGQFPFADCSDGPDLVHAKRDLAAQLPDRLPKDVAQNANLLHLLGGLIAPDPARRFATAEAAELAPNGAAAFHRELIRSNLASEYENELRLWISEIE